MSWWSDNWPVRYAWQDPTHCSIHTPHTLYRNILLHTHPTHLLLHTQPTYTAPDKLNVFNAENNFAVLCSRVDSHTCSFCFVFVFQSGARRLPKGPVWGAGFVGVSSVAVQWCEVLWGRRCGVRPRSAAAWWAAGRRTCPCTPCPSTRWSGASGSSSSSRRFRRTLARTWRSARPISAPTASLTRTSTTRDSPRSCCWRREPSRTCCTPLPNSPPWVFLLFVYDKNLLLRLYCAYTALFTRTTVFIKRCQATKHVCLHPFNNKYCIYWRIFVIISCLFLWWRLCGLPDRQKHCLVVSACLLSIFFRSTLSDAALCTFYSDVLSSVNSSVLIFKYVQFQCTFLRGYGDVKCSVYTPLINHYFHLLSDISWYIVVFMFKVARSPETVWSPELVGFQVLFFFFVPP